MDMGPIRPRYMATVTISLPAMLSVDVTSLVRPTVAQALMISKSPSLKSMGVVAIRRRVNTSTVIMLTSTMTEAFFIRALSIVRLKTFTLLFPLM